ncbi:Hsp20/alpha crystallin family protein [Ktedonosporobacter rubrisoli]|uniref:Hsp20/alpha crystallin family protein n=1 Tax=Ktedonosporobacter rubrisoli TaxID=2509675 RepID=A0A4P6K3N1_KTERU|nr:Hsp20/alpha crystallin family protein [Ktedonosporobacter rubrisoli]QBD82655.1 Hsp20/alpha crystallin family protein [Ktedonosporobacter rubrisoli]
MQERAKVQQIPVKIYRSSDRLMVATPMPGLQPEDILIKITEDGHMVVEGEVRGVLKEVKELVLDEWSVGGYYRELELPNAVDALHANATYGNGVLVVAMPMSERTVGGTLMLSKTGDDHGERVGNVGHESAHETMGRPG